MRLIACAITATLLTLSVGIGQEKKKTDEKKPEPNTKEWLLGKWRHPKAGTIAFSKDDKGSLSTVAFVNGMFTSSSLQFEYDIDPKTNIVQMNRARRTLEPPSGLRTASFECSLMLQKAG